MSDFVWMLGAGAVSGLYWYVVGVRRGIERGGIAVAAVLRHMPLEQQQAFTAAFTLATIKVVGNPPTGSK